jgi:amidase
MNNRRDFLKTTAAGLAAMALLRDVKGGTMDVDPYPELVEMTIAEMQAKMRAGELTSRRLAEMYLERIKMIDTRTHSVLELNPEALAIFKRLSREERVRKIVGTGHSVA